MTTTDGIVLLFTAAAVVGLAVMLIDARASAQRTVPIEVPLLDELDRDLVIDPDLSAEIDEDWCWQELEQRVLAAAAPNPRLREVHGSWFAYDRRLAQLRRAGWDG